MLLLMTGCVSNLKDSDKSGGKKGFGGLISKTMDFIIPSAHAAAEVCTSAKSSGSQFYAELYEISDLSVLGTDTESSGLSKLCDVDVVSNSYFFEVDEDLLGDAPVKIKIVDTRSGGTNNGKEILTTSKATDFSISKEKTIQAKLVQKNLKENGFTAGSLNLSAISLVVKKYHVDLISMIIQNNNNLAGKSLDLLVNSTSVFELKADSFYTLYPSYTDFGAVPHNIRSNSAEFDISGISGLPQSELCFLNLDSDASDFESELAICESMHGGSESLVEDAIIALIHFIDSDADMSQQIMLQPESLPILLDDFISVNVEFAALTTSQKDEVLGVVGSNYVH
jgi:hypothetical protein